MTIRGWFFNIPLEKIQRGNCEEFLASMFFYCTPSKLPENHKKTLDTFVKSLEKILNYEFTPGYNQAAKCMRNMFDPVICDHRLLMVYLGVIVLDFFNRLFLYMKGFSYRQVGIVRYFHKRGNL
jgi:hypothetical protein